MRHVRLVFIALEVLILMLLHGCDAILLLLPGRVVDVVLCGVSLHSVPLVKRLGRLMARCLLERDELVQLRVAYVPVVLVRVRGKNLLGSVQLLLLGGLLLVLILNKGVYDVVLKLVS